jgi:hypothetical protein
MVTSRLRPLDVKLVFEDRPYHLGESVRFTVELHTKRDAEIREGRVALVCDMRYTEVTTALPRYGGRAGGVVVPVQSTEEHEESDVVESVVFITAAQLRSGRTVTYNSRLDIPTELPESVSGSSGRTRATMKWTLVASFDVAGARDVNVSHPINVRAILQGERDDDSSVGKLTPEQRRDNARKTAQARWDKARGRD